MPTWLFIGLIVMVIWQKIYVPNPEFNSPGNIVGNIVGAGLCVVFWPIPALLLIHRFIKK